jgi:hypothetical protein
MALVLYHVKYLISCTVEAKGMELQGWQGPGPGVRAAGEPAELQGV